MADKLYEWEPSTRFKHAPIGPFFVDVSAGGTLTHFAAPRVRMVGALRRWETGYISTIRWS